MQRHPGLVILRERHVDHRPRVFAKRAVLAIPNDPYDFTPRTPRALKAHPLSERLLAAEVAACYRFADDCSQRRAFIVFRGEVAAVRHRNPHRLKVLQPDDVRVHNVRVLGIGAAALAAAYVVGTFLALNEKAEVAAGTAQRDDARKAGRFDAGKRFDPLDDLPVEFAPLRFCVLQQIDVDPGVENFVGIETGIDALRIAQAAQEQAGADQQHQRQRHLRHHENIAKTEALTSLCCCRSFILQRGHQIGPRGLHRRREPEDNSSRKRQREGKCEHAAIQPIVQSKRKDSRRRGRRL